MNDKAPQFANVAEVRKFMRDSDSYDAIFGDCTDEQVMSIVETGMIYTDDNLPAINYSERKTLDENCVIALENARIRMLLHEASCTFCLQAEARRAEAAGFTDVTRVKLISIAGKMRK